jgi:hypothetical protein
MESLTEELPKNNEEYEIADENLNSVSGNLQLRLDYEKILDEIANEYGNAQNLPDELLKIKINEEENFNHPEMEKNLLEL